MASIIIPFLRAINPRVAISAALIAVLAYFFWTGSRYPALDEKVMMSGAIQLEDALSFEAAFDVHPDMALGNRVFWSTLNWINTNLKGMTFGIMFAAAFLTLIGQLKRRSFASPWANAILGMGIGAPLGVCVNCAAPIARGMYAGGLRAETVMAAMMASPTLNIVVLTMAFSLLPFYMVVTKIVLSVVMILGIVPLVCRLLPAQQVAPTPTVPPPQPWSPAELAQSSSEPLLRAAAMVAKTFVVNLWYIIRLTVPLMLVAGTLGTLAAVLLPPELVTGLPFGITVLLCVAVVGLFLPVPIAFDVVLCGIFLGLGMSQGYVMALLITLGSFSIYSFFIVAQAISLRAASLLSAAVLLMGILAGMGAQTYHQWQSHRALQMLMGASGIAQPPARARETRSLWAAQAATLDVVTTGEISAATLSTRQLSPPSAPADTLFTRIEASELGIDKPVEFSFRDMWPPFWEGRSLSTGDIDRDGDLDVIVASTHVGLYAYANDGSGHFTPIPLPGGPLTDMPVFNAALVDINNDGWLDLFVATYRQGNYLVLGSAEGLQTQSPHPVANRSDAVLSLGLAFGDPDQDGDLDVALGNWAAGWYRRIPGEESRNRILWNTDNTLTGEEFSDLPAIPGETLSVLFSDIDANGTLDLWAGNDFEIPDAIYLGDGNGAFSQITYQDGIIPKTTTTTMAVKSADLTGNGRPEIYLAQIAGRSSGVSDTLKMQPLDFYCDSIKNRAALATCRKNMAIKSWYKSGNNFDPTYAARCQELSGNDQTECKAMLVKDLAIQQRKPEICALIPAGQDIAKSYCDLHFKPARQITEAEANASIPQILRSNVLLQWQTDSGTFADTALAHGLDVGGWSWDTKIEDFDLDGDLDVYIVNGTWVPNEVSPSNLYFENDGYGNFTESSGPAGLEDYLLTAAAVAFDADGDGDLDMLTHPVNGPLVFFRNAAQTGNRLVVTLDDQIGNRDGVGAIVTVTDNQAVQYRREIQLGGGFMSFDAPRVTFGLPAGRLVQNIRVRWPDGRRSELNGPFDFGSSIRIGRPPH
jgi:uncharacterized membrane protein YraQ (UPF0718 family)